MSPSSRSPPSGRLYTPLTSSPLNPDQKTSSPNPRQQARRTTTPATPPRTSNPTGATPLTPSIRHAAALVRGSPTECLLRHKAALAWRAETTLRHHHHVAVCQAEEDYRRHHYHHHYHRQQQQQQQQHSPIPYHKPSAEGYRHQSHRSRDPSRAPVAVTAAASPTPGEEKALGGRGGRERRLGWVEAEAEAEAAAAEEEGGDIGLVTVRVVSKRDGVGNSSRSRSGWEDGGRVEAGFGVYVGLESGGRGNGEVERSVRVVMRSRNDEALMGVAVRGERRRVRPRGRGGVSLRYVMGVVAMLIGMGLVHRLLGVFWSGGGGGDAGERRPLPVVA